MKSQLTTGDDDLSHGPVLEQVVEGFIQLQIQSEVFMVMAMRLCREGRGRMGGMKKSAAESGLSTPGIHCWG